MSFQDQINRMHVVNGLAEATEPLVQPPVPTDVTCRFCGEGFESLSAVRRHQRKDCVKRDAAIGH
jgi:hypothetical protein